MGKRDHHPHEAQRFAGYRAMLAVRATNREWQGVAGDFGMYLFSHAMWLVGEMERGGFDRLVFLARDGKLVKAAFDAVNGALNVPVETDYVRVSRQAVLPLQFRCAEDLSMLPETVQTAGHTPRTLLALFAPVIDGERAERVLEAAGLSLDAPLDEGTTARFIGAFRERVYDRARFDAYREYARTYLAPHFVGKCATFDVGYNLRSESVIAEVTGADVTAFITHTDSDLPDRRGLPYRTLYPASPYVSWVAREQFLLTKGDPPCLRYAADGPVLGNCPDIPRAMKEVQRCGMDFVREMARVYGAELRNLPFRPVDGCLPFERFLHCASRREMGPFRKATVENRFHDGAGEEDYPFLQWRLMQTDYIAAKTGAPRWRTKLRRLAIRVREAPRTVPRHLKRR